MSSIYSAIDYQSILIAKANCPQNFMLFPDASLYDYNNILNNESYRNAIL